MEQPQFSCPELNNFLENRQKEIVAIAQQASQMVAQKVSKEVVEKEMALMDFELLLSANMPEELKLTEESRRLRDQSWKEVNNQFNGNYKEAMEFIDNF